MYVWVYRSLFLFICVFDNANNPDKSELASLMNIYIHSYDNPIGVIPVQEDRPLYRKKLIQNPHQEQLGGILYYIHIITGSSRLPTYIYIYIRNFAFL